MKKHKTKRHKSSKNKEGRQNGQENVRPPFFCENFLCMRFYYNIEEKSQLMKNGMTDICSENPKYIIHGAYLTKQKSGLMIKTYWQCMVGEYKFK